MWLCGLWCISWTLLCYSGGRYLCPGQNAFLLRVVGNSSTRWNLFRMRCNASSSRHLQCRMRHQRLRDTVWLHKHQWLWLQFTSCLEWGFICIMGNSRMAAQGLLVFESLSTEFTLYLLLNTTVLGYNVPLCIRLLNKSFPTDCAASPSIHPTGNEFLGHKTLQKYVVNFINCSKTQLQNFICCIHREFASCETSWIVLFCMFFHNGGNLPDLSQCVETRYAAYSSTCSEETVCHRVGR